MPIVEKYAIQPKDGYHGLYTHTAAVVFRGIDFAMYLDRPVQPVVLACAFHDMARMNDKSDSEHGIWAVPLARRVMDEIGENDIKIRESIFYAIENHPFNIPVRDYIHMCLVDADRTRLAWDPACGGYQAKYLTSARAHLVAFGSWEHYLDFMRNNMSLYARSVIQHIDKAY